MRRSKAPSVLKKTKRLRTTDGLDTESHSDPEDEDYKWGSGSGAQYGEIYKRNRNENKRIFNVVWRDVSTKKHKTWKGDGILEVNEQATKVILKDETGKYLACSTKLFNVELGPDVQMIVGNKEIEILDEIKNEEELLKMQKGLVQNRNWGDEEDSKKEQKISKGGFIFRPLLMLKSPQTAISNEHFSENGNQTNKDMPISSAKMLLNTPKCSRSPRYILSFVRPSELQQFLFQKVMDYYDSVKSLTWKAIESLDIPLVLQHICNHPSFINHKSSSNELIRHLMPILPDLSEMGPFDSGKLEFIQLFLTENRQNCIIVAKNASSSNMLQGLCDFMHLKCLRLNTNLSVENQQKIFNEYSNNYNNLTQILLINSLDLLLNTKNSITIKNLIIFDDFTLNMNILNATENVQNCTVYYLVTAFSIEELLLLKNNADKEDLSEILHELSNLSNLSDNCCYLHTKIQCKCLDLKMEKNENPSLVASMGHTFLSDWKHLANPFDEKFLKVAYLDNCAENIVTIFYKNI